MSKPSRRPGMGAVPYEGGATFRVWAPNARGIAVVGDFNDWSPDANPLAPDGDGYWSADVDDVKPGHEYRFAVFPAEGEPLSRIDPYARQVTNSVGNAVVVDTDFDWKDDDFQMPPWNELVIYELHVGTFNDEPGGSPGDLQSAASRLPHLAELGVNAVQIMPPVEFAADFSWGYNPAHPFAVESAYGGPHALKRFIAAAHRHGLAVIFDVVYNHFGPGDLDLWRFDGWYEDDKGGIYFYNDWRSTTPWGDTRPDYGRPEVRNYIRDNALFWLEDFRVDGLRWDATAFIRNVHGFDHDSGADLPDGWSLMRWVNDEINARMPWKIAIAEDLKDNPVVTRPTSEGGAGFDAQWDAAFVHPVRRALIAEADEDRHVGDVAQAIAHAYDAEPFRRVIYTESHDEVANGQARVPEEIWPGNADSWAAKKRSTLGAALVMTAPGIPMLFQGQEFLEDRWFQDGDPIDWDKRDRFAGIVALYRDLIRLRRADPATRGLRGRNTNMYHVNDWDKVLAFHRWEDGGAGDDVVVLANFTAGGHEGYRIGLPRPGMWRVRFNSDSAAYDAEFGDHPGFDVEAEEQPQDGMGWSAPVPIGPYTALILSQD